MNERQRQIIAAAIPLFLKEGISVPTSRIAKVAGVSNGTLFNAFATKQDLLDAIYRATKLSMFAAFPPPEDVPFGRHQLRSSWDTYLTWARAAPDDHKVMHLLKDSGLASAEVQAEIEELSAPHAYILMKAWEQGTIRGPSIGFISDVIFAQIDLVISHNLTGADEDLAFDMLCNTLGIDTP
ncbi:MAG: TetR/AcrR family transcriptional regulator [Parvularculaceae bacterium]|nr:TetR/AcrR family transcriptional regulator [Parvularculaceae bacterium]